MDEAAPIKTYTEAGRGRKQCPKCNTYVGVRNAKCVCGHDFKENDGDEPEAEVNTYTEAGRGRKQCPKCNTYVGVRNAKCVCGHEFQKGETTNANDEYAVPTTEYSGGLLSITTPAGPCPAKLTGTDEKSVREWVERIQDHGRQNQRFYTNEALRYYLWLVCDHDREGADYRAAVEWL